MSFTMTHLITARRITELYPNLAADLPQFYLGSIAPDSVHYRENYVSDFKKKSHLHSCAAEWGDCVSYDECADNAVTFLREREGLEIRDFVYGYTVHLLCDICNNKLFWQPYLQNHPEAWRTGYNNLCHREAGLMDFWQYRTYSHRDEIWAALEQAEAHDLEGLVSGGEVETHRRHILYKQYCAPPETDIAGNKLHTPESESEFIELAAAFIAEKLGL